MPDNTPEASLVVKFAWGDNVFWFFAFLLVCFFHILICLSNISLGLQQTVQQLEFEKAAGGEQSFAESA